MPHIHEGALHAYLDGALEEYSAAEAERVREHLERCAACRGRLEEERETRARAQSILGLATPEVEVPALEELRARARRSAPGRGPARVRLYRIGWAASLILAMGTGWLLRGGDAVSPSATEGVPSDGAVPRSATGEAAPAVAAPAVQDAGPRETVVADRPPQPVEAQPDAGRSVSGGGLLSTGTEPAPAPAEAVPDDGLSADEPPPADLLAERIVGSAPEEPRLAGSIPESGRQAVPAGRAADPGRQGAEAPERRRAPVGIVTSASQVAPVTGLGPLQRSVEYGDYEDERVGDEDSYSLVVPGLDVLEVRFRGGVRPEGQIVLQRLESGDTLSVIHLPQEIDPSTLAPPAPTDLQVVVQRTAGSIVMRAPVPEQELLGLMERLLTAR